MVKKFEDWLNEDKVLSLDEATITTIKGFNTESDTVILMLDYYKDNKTYKNIITPAALEYYSGGNNVYEVLKLKFYKFLKIDDLEKIMDKLNNLNLSYMVMSSPKAKVLDFFSKLLAQGIMFELRESPIQFAKYIGDPKVIKAADNFSINRGKEKFSTMLNNKRGK